MDQSAAIRLESQLAALWQRGLPVLLERLNLLDHAAAAGSSLSPEDLNQARNIAHKLAGSLGVFGYNRGTEIARSIELLLSAMPAAPLEQLPALTAELRLSIFPSA